MTIELNLYDAGILAVFKRRDHARKLCNSEYCNMQNCNQQVHYSQYSTFQNLNTIQAHIFFECVRKIEGFTKSEDIKRSNCGKWNLKNLFRGDMAFTFRVQWEKQMKLRRVMDLT